MNTIHNVEIADEINRSRAMVARAAQIGVKDAARLYGRHPSSLWRLKKQIKAGLPACDRRHFNPGAASSLDNRRVEWALAFMSARQGAALSVVCRELNKVAETEGWPKTNYYALRRAIEKLPADVRKLLAAGGKAAFEKTGLVGKRVQSRPLELVQMDASEMPIWTVHPATGELIKPWMTGIIDGHSRVILGMDFHLGSPDAFATASALADAFSPKNDESWPFFGIPETVQSDNAQAYVGKVLSGIAVRANFILDHIPAGCPSANGKIERFFQTFQDSLLSRLAGYASQSHAKGKAETRGVIPWEVLKSVCRRYLLEYHSSVHSGIGTTPWEAWHENIQDAPGYLIPPAEIRRKMRVAVTCDVTREGVQVMGTGYSGKALNGLVGDMVTVLCSAKGGDQSVEAFHRGNQIGFLRPVPLVTADINAARLKRQINLSGFRKKMREEFENCPPEQTPEVVLPKEERKRMKTAQKKTPRNRTIKPARFEVEGQKEAK